MMSILQGGIADENVLRHFSNTDSFLKHEQVEQQDSIHLWAENFLVTASCDTAIKTDQCTRNARQ